MNKTSIELFLIEFIVSIYYFLVVGCILVDILSKEVYFITKKKDMLYLLFPFFFIYKILKNLIKLWWENLE
jgi:hypothetical protein